MVIGNLIVPGELLSNDEIKYSCEPYIRNLLDKLECSGTP